VPPPPPLPHDTRNPRVVIASAIINTPARCLRRRAIGSPANTAPKAIIPPVHGSFGAWFAAELDAVIVKLTVLLPLADNVAVPLDGLTVMSDELGVTVQVVVSAYVVDDSVMLTACEPPLLSDTEVADGVMVYAGAVTVSVCVPLDARNPVP